MEELDGRREGSACMCGRLIAEKHFCGLHEYFDGCNRKRRSAFVHQFTF